MGRPSIGEHEPICDIIMIAWNQLESTRRALESVLSNTRVSFRLILIDNGSEPPTAEFLRRFASDLGDRCALIRNPENLGFIKAANQGLLSSRAPFVCLLNNDVLVTEGWLDAMLSFARSHPEIGLVNPVSVEGDRAGDPLRYRIAGEWSEEEFATGECLLMRREVFEKLGLFDESYGIGYYEDLDYSRRAQSVGLGCARTRDAVVVHHRGTSFAKRFEQSELDHHRDQNRSLYEERWGRRVHVLVPLAARLPDSSEDVKRIVLALRAAAGANVRIFLYAPAEPGATVQSCHAFYGIGRHSNFKIELFHLDSIGRPFPGPVARLVFYVLAVHRMRRRIRKIRRNRHPVVLLTTAAGRATPWAFGLVGLGVPIRRAELPAGGGSDRRGGGAEMASRLQAEFSHGGKLGGRDAPRAIAGT